MTDNMDLVQAAMAQLKEQGGSEESGPSISDEDLDLIANEAFAAVKADDKAAFNKALKNLIKAHNLR